MADSKKELKWLVIDGSIEIDVNIREFNSEFGKWLDSKGWEFKGTTSIEEEIAGETDEEFCPECMAKFEANEGELRVMDMCEDCRTIALENILGSSLGSSIVQ